MDIAMIVSSKGIEMVSFAFEQIDSTSNIDALVRQTGDLVDTAGRGYNIHDESPIQTYPVRGVHCTA